MRLGSRGAHALALTLPAGCGAGTAALVGGGGSRLDPLSAAAGDLDGDGLPELLGGDGQVSSLPFARLYRAILPGRYDTACSLSTPGGLISTASRPLRILDLDGDADLDVLMSKNDQEWLVFHGGR